MKFSSLFLFVFLLWQEGVEKVQSQQEQTTTYIPAKVEQNVLDIKNHNSSSGCLIWNQESPLKHDLELWKKELTYYIEQMNTKNCRKEAPDVRTLFLDDNSNREQVCREYADTPPPPQQQQQQSPDHSDPKTVQLKSTTSSSTTTSTLRGRKSLADDDTSSSPYNLMHEYFQASQQLSYLPRMGYMEPLVPPLRHPEMCRPNMKPGYYMGIMDYLIEDFGHICRHVLHKTMRTVFLDIGACYNFESDGTDVAAAAIQAIEKYRRNGIHFDHIYAYEVRPVATELVYATVPKHMRGPMHWINMPANPEEGHDHNPWTMLLDTYKPDDFIVVKLDIDTPSVELPLFQQLLDSPELQKLVDVFYFEHHVQMDEMQQFWGKHEWELTKGTIVESLEMFQRLRKAGVAAHYWI